MNGVLSGPGVEPSDGDCFRSVHKKDGAHYNIYGNKPQMGMAGLKQIFPDGAANELNFVLFSTSGVHGSYTSLDDIETGLTKYGDAPDFEEWPDDWSGTTITYLIVHPRIVCLRYGNAEVTLADIPFLKKLRETSRAAVLTIG